MCRCGEPEVGLLSRRAGCSGSQEPDRDSGTQKLLCSLTYNIPAGPTVEIRYSLVCCRKAPMQGGINSGRLYSHSSGGEKTETQGPVRWAGWSRDCEAGLEKCLAFSLCLYIMFSWTSPAPEFPFV